MQEELKETETKHNVLTFKQAIESVIKNPIGFHSFNEKVLIDMEDKYEHENITQVYTSTYSLDGKLISTNVIKTSNMSNMSLSSRIEIEIRSATKIYLNYIKDILSETRNGNFKKKQEYQKEKIELLDKIIKLEEETNFSGGDIRLIFQGTFKTSKNGDFDKESNLKSLKLSLKKSKYNLIKYLYETKKLENELEIEIRGVEGYINLSEREKEKEKEKNTKIFY